METCNLKSFSLTNENVFDTILDVTTDEGRLKIRLTPPQLIQLAKQATEMMWKCYDLVPRG